MTSPQPPHLGLDLLSFVWPAACLGCGLANRDWCFACRAEFHSSHETLEVIPHDGGDSRWVASGTYSGMRKELIVRLKHQGQLGFARHLGRALSGPLETLIRAKLERRERPLIVPIPSRKARVRSRGYRHLELILRHASVRSSDIGNRTLLPISGRTGQVGLNEGERRRNAARIRLREGARVAGRTVILVDDVVTTGATLAAAQTLLSQHGARVVGAATIAVALKLREEKTEKCTNELA